MARADLLYELIKYGLASDSVSFRKATEAICAEERAKQHIVLASKIEDLLKISNRNFQRNQDFSNTLIKTNINDNNLFLEKVPQKRLEQLILPESTKNICTDFITEQSRVNLLQSYGLEPRNKLLLVGPPGNGKTSLAEAIAESLMLPFLTVRYESIIGSYLGETALRLSKLIEYAKTRQCVLFFDEFETLGKERGDIHETGEIKRVVSSLLMHIDSLPSYVIVIAATNHESLLDKAAWRRFQIKLEIPQPTRKNLEDFLVSFEKQRSFKFGLQPSTIVKKIFGVSFAEAEEIALTIYRQYVLEMPNSSEKDVTNKVLMYWNEQLKSSSQLKLMEENE